jgi:uncharacterized delta-60 repeat protein
MSPKLRFFTHAAIIVVFLAAPFRSYSLQLDPTFGGSPQQGVLTMFYGWSQFVTNVWGVRAFRRADNSIIFLVRNGGSNGKGGDVNAMTVAFLPPDAGSYSHTNLGLRDIIATEAAMRPDGNLAAAGNLGAGDMFIERFNSDGNAAGVTDLGFGNNIDRPTNISTRTDGKIIVTGKSTNAGGSLTVVAMLNPDGTFDSTFGPYGNGTLDIYDNAVLSQKMTIRPDGKILLAGNYVDGPETVSMFYLLNSDGSPDTSFGDGGLAFAFDTGTTLISDVKPQPDGKIVTLATQSVPEPGETAADQKILLRRLNANGSIDTGFGENGLVTANTSPATVFGPTSFDPSGAESSRELVVESTGNIVAILRSDQVIPTSSGVSYPRLLRKHAVYLLRFSAAGSLMGRNISRKMPFNGAYTLPNPPPSDVKGGFEQPGKGIVVHGSVNPGAGTSAFVARYSAISAPNNANNFFDYNFDGRAEFGSYVPGTSGFSKWRLARTHTDFPGSYQLLVLDFGLNGDVPVPGDYDGDGIQDLAVFRDGAGDWFTRKVYLTGCAPMDCTAQVHFGLPGDVPAPGDFDGDGITDRAVFRPSEGNWYILFSSGGYTGLHFGQNGDLPVTGDYDNDGKSDVAVIRRENGLMTWFVLQSSNNQFIGIQFGLDSDKAVPADYTGDGKTDIAVWRASEGNWYTLSNYTAFSALHWGMAGDIPEPADYDGDGKADFAIYRPSELTHYARASHDGSLISYYAGTEADIPIPSVYVR